MAHPRIDPLKTLRSQIHGKKAGFLLGAGSSYLGGNGYPLANGLWTELQSRIDPKDATRISKAMNRSGAGLEDALDALDKDPSRPFPLRERIGDAVAKVLGARNPPLDTHRRFVRGLAKRRDCRVPVLTLNYDPLVELAGALEECLVFDGFIGVYKAAFKPASFNYRVGMPSTRRGKPVTELLHGIIDLIKLHGSLGWYQLDGRIERRDPALELPVGCRRLLIPPQRRKHQDTATPPYSNLWSEFRGLLANDGPRLLNRLICVGYGFRDEHVNAILRAALNRHNFTLVILSKSLDDRVYAEWARSNRAIVVTETRSTILNNEVDPIPKAWSFEWLAEEIAYHA